MVEGKQLITTDAFFYAPDGQQYKAAWGSVKIIDDSNLGIKTNRQSTNWFAIVGGNGKEIIIAGCQIHYSIRCDYKPRLIPHINEEIYEGKQLEFEVKSRIYIAE
jgi:hypothetical protein